MKRLGLISVVSLLVMLTMGAFCYRQVALAEGLIKEYAVHTSNSRPWGITAGPDGNLWFTEADGNKIGCITTSGAIKEYGLPTPDSQPSGIIAGPDGNLWFAEWKAHKVGKITTLGLVNEYSVPDNGDPTGITTGPDGNLWFTEYDSGNIGKITTSGTVTIYTAHAALPLDIVTGPDGNLWFTEVGDSIIGKITTSGTVTEYNLPGYHVGPTGITAGPDGNLWFTEYPEHHIGKISPSGKITVYDAYVGGGVNFITAGPDGNLWFTEYFGSNGTSAIGKITQSGEVTEYPMPSSTGTGAGQGLECITTGPDGNLWFAEAEVNKIGVFQFSDFYFAEGTCRPNFDPYICIQNPGISDADVTITYMKGDGTSGTQTLTIGKDSRSTVRVKDTLGEGDDPAHDFSARVECTNGQEIIAERPMYFNYNGVWTGGHDVVGARFPASTFYFAEGTCRPNFDPYLCIQNPGVNDADITITYMKGNDTTDKQTLTVGKNSRSTVRVKDKLGEGDNPAHDFSAKVECTNGQKIIAERPMYFNYQGASQLNWTGGHDVMGATSPSSAFYFAEGTCRPNFDPYICIQNPGHKNAAVKITYMKGDGTTDTQSLTVGKNSRSTVVVKGRLGEGNDPAHDFSAKVECNNGQKIIAERPMYFNYNGVWTGGHDVMGATSPSSAFYFAEGTCRPNFDPYLCIQNPGVNDADITITYMKGDGTTDTQSLTVGKNSRSTVRVKDKLGEGNDPAHDFSAKVECNNGQKIIAERPMYFNYNGVWTGGHDVVGATP